MINANVEAKMAIAKSDIVVSAAVNGNGFVHYIMATGMACVEFPVWGKAYIHVDDLTKVGDSMDEGWAAPSSISHNGRD
jgi:hypothetical protein